MQIDDVAPKAQPNLVHESTITRTVTHHSSCPSRRAKARYPLPFRSSVCRNDSEQPDDEQPARLVGRAPACSLISFRVPFISGPQSMTAKSPTTKRQQACANRARAPAAPSGPRCLAFPPRYQHTNKTKDSIQTKTATTHELSSSFSLLALLLIATKAGLTRRRECYLAANASLTYNGIMVSPTTTAPAPPAFRIVIKVFPANKHDESFFFPFLCLPPLIPSAPTPTPTPTTTKKKKKPFLPFRDDITLP